MMRILLASGEQAAGGIIRSLKSAGHEVAGILSPEEGLHLEPSWRLRPLYFRFRFGTIKSLNITFDIPLRVVGSLDDGSLRTWVRCLQPDLLLVLGWPTLMPESFLQLFPYGGINIHPSLLPLLKGADPIFSSVLNDTKGYGITFHKMAKEIDGGNVLLQKPLRRKKLDSYETLYFRFIRVAIRLTPLILKTIHENPKGKVQSGPSSTTTRFHWRHAIYSPSDSPELVVRKTLACYSHHKMHAMCGKTLFSFTHCTEKKGRVVHSSPFPIVKVVGFSKIAIQHGNQQLILSGIKLISPSLWISILFIPTRLKKGQILASKTDVRKAIKSIKNGKI